jgi:adenosylhomocysteine nucleosidase
MGNTLMPWRWESFCDRGALGSEDLGVRMKFPYLKYKSDFLENMSEVKNLLIVVAMDSEEKALINGVQSREVTYGKKLKITSRQFDLPKCRVTVARSGVGLVRAGILLHAIAEHQPVDAILQLGVGGALDRELNVGDTVVAREIIQHDSVSSSDHGNNFIAPGELVLSAPSDQQVDPIMRCDSVLVNWIKSAFALAKCGKVFEGTILSGSEFAASTQRKQALKALAHNVLLVDMEAAALAQVARMLQIPFVSAKTVADRADPKSSIPDDYKKFLESAASHSASVLQALLKTFHE